MATHATPAKTSFEDYLEREREAEFKNEYWAGEVLAMSGGRAAHSELSTNIIYLLKGQLRGRCRVFDSNLRVYIKAADLCVYPDAMAVCGEIEYYKNHQDVIVNPTLVVEVLSPSTRNYDLGPKAAAYRTIESLRDIVFVDSERIFVKHMAREADEWQWAEHTDRSAGSIAIFALGFSIPLAEIYDGVL